MILNRATSLLEELAGETWHRLRYAHLLGISQGEETISDILLLEIAMSNVPEIRRVEKCPKHLERWNGIDWEWIIGSNQFGWIKYAIQAKKLYLNSNDTSKGRYKSLHEPFNDGTTQLAVLRSYAKENKMVPLYCLYNFIDKQSFVPFWNCFKKVDKEQLGCSVTPLEVAEIAVSTYGGRSFDNMHCRPETVPWRCLVSCPDFLDVYKENFENRKRQNGRIPEVTSIEHRMFGEVFIHNQPLDTLKTAFDQRFNEVTKRLLVIDIDANIVNRIG